MKSTATVILIVSVLGIVASACAEPGIELNAGAEAELELAQKFDDYSTARNSVLQVIASIKDESKRKAVSLVFERSERAWGELVESEALLKQGAISVDAPVDIRYRRIVDADRAPQRIEHYKEFVRIIQIQSEN